MNRLEQLTTLKDHSNKLIELGIVPKAFFWHLKELEDKDEQTVISWDVCILNEPIYTEGVKIPAWTKGEIDVMIGPDFDKADLYSDDEVNKCKGAKDFDRDKFPVFMPSTLYETKNGADASAKILIFLLENMNIDPNKCNERYAKIFKPC